MYPRAGGVDTLVGELGVEGGSRLRVLVRPWQRGAATRIVADHVPPYRRLLRSILGPY